jgi:carbon monoxide dehydrogenase subunit G
MIGVSRTFVVDQAVGAVVDYLADLGHAEQWDPGTKSSVRVDSGPIQVGSSWRNVSTLMGRETEVTFSLDRLEPDHIVFTGSNSSATSTDDIAVRAVDGGSEIIYASAVDLRGMAKLAAPMLKPELEKQADQMVAGITRALAGA